MIKKRKGLFAKVLFILVLSIFNVLMAQETVNCPAPPAEAELCRNLNLNIQKNLLLDNLLLAGKGNNPTEALNVRRSLEELSQMAFNCGLISNCNEMTTIRNNDIGSGWREKIEMTSFPSGQGCSFSTEVQVVNGVTTIRGIISRGTGRLSYTLPYARCTPVELEVERRVTISEFGMLFVDYSNHVDAFPGSWLLLKKKRTPQMALQSNGNMRVVMSDGHYFEVDAGAGRIISSDMINADMFDSGQCRSIVRNEGTRTFTDVKLLPEASARIGARFTDFGGTKTEREIESYVASLRRQPL